MGLLTRWGLLVGTAVSAAAPTMLEIQLLQFSNRFLLVLWRGRDPYIYQCHSMSA